MYAKDIINEMISTVSVNDSGVSVQSLMDEYKVEHLPVVDGTKYVGLISEQDILSMEWPEKPIATIVSTIAHPYIQHAQHLLETLPIISNEKISLLPVLCDKGTYLGVIRLEDILYRLSNLLSADSPGGLIVLEMNVNNYTLAEISQIVESNNAKVLNLYVSSHPDSTQIFVTMKLNVTDIRAVIQTFNRYNYVVHSTFLEGENWQDLRDRYDYMMNFLNI
ncbi:MAG: CBS domain-containing protein [Bacteroidales bacterium]|nr:CBS domain-containing protein [Bacteroidales bacterium]